MVKDADHVLREPRHVSQSVARALARTIVVPVRPYGGEVLPRDSLQICRARRVHDDRPGFNSSNREIVAKITSMLRPVSKRVPGCKVSPYPRQAWSYPLSAQGHRPGAGTGPAAVKLLSIPTRISTSPSTRTLSHAAWPGCAKEPPVSLLRRAPFSHDDASMEQLIGRGRPQEDQW